MTSAFSPAHITCFFRPVGSDDILSKGSRGAGIRLSKGTTVHISEISGRTKVTLNGHSQKAPITEHVLRNMSPDRNFDVTVECDLPLGQGFGMSASGAVAAALCLSEMTGKSRQDAFEAAHRAEVECGGGLGDVAGIMCDCHQPIRIREGIPPAGSIIDGGIAFESLSLVIIGDELRTSSVLNDPGTVSRICEAGDRAMFDYLSDTTRNSLFRISNRFSKESGVISDDIESMTFKLGAEGIRSSMCMLGNSIFSDSPSDVIEDIIGDPLIIGTSSTDVPAQIIRKA